MKKNLFFAAIAALTLAACSNNHDEEITEASEPVTLGVSANFANVVVTRDDAAGETWTEGAKMLVFVASSVTASKNELCGDALEEKLFTYELKSGSGSTTGTFKSDNPYVFSVGESSSHFRAFTYNTAEAPAYECDVNYNNRIIFNLSTDNGSFPDILSSDTKLASFTEPSVGFNFSHLLSKLTIKVVSKIDGVTVTGLKFSGYYKSLIVSVIGTDQAELDASDPDQSGVTLSETEKDFILATGSQDITIEPQTENNNGYKFSSKISKNFEAGKHYTCTITLEQKFTATSCTITSWEEEEMEEPETTLSVVATV
jgi:hypothetical protein